MNSGAQEPIFEATFEHEGVLVREDVLLPTGGASWRIVEVKASTKVKPEHVQDCAIQAWVHLGAGYALDSISLAHIDNQFRYRGDGDYAGLLVENDLSEEVRNILPSVPAWVEKAKQAVDGPLPNTPVGAHCTKPYACPFMEFCWPNDTDYPVAGLGGGKRKLGLLVMNGCRDICYVPSAEKDRAALSNTGSSSISRVIRPCVRWPNNW